jgi:hypothetical protein
MQESEPSSLLRLSYKQRINQCASEVQELTTSSKDTAALSLDLKQDLRRIRTSLESTFDDVYFSTSFALDALRTEYVKSVAAEKDETAKCKKDIREMNARDEQQKVMEWSEAQVKKVEEFCRGAD